jgi:hypothetical protein
LLPSSNNNRDNNDDDNNDDDNNNDNDNDDNDNDSHGYNGDNGDNGDRKGGNEKEDKDQDEDDLGDDAGHANNSNATQVHADDDGNNLHATKCGENLPKIFVGSVISHVYRSMYTTTVTSIVTEVKEDGGKYCITTHRDHVLVVGEDPSMTVKVLGSVLDGHKYKGSDPDKYNWPQNSIQISAMEFSKANQRYSRYMPIPDNCYDKRFRLTECTFEIGPKLDSFVVSSALF